MTTKKGRVKHSREECSTYIQHREKKTPGSWANAEAKAKFETETIKRNLLPEKGFRYGKGLNYGLIGEVAEVIDAQGMKRFVEHPT